MTTHQYAQKHAQAKSKVYTCNSIGQRGLTALILAFLISFLPAMTCAQTVRTVAVTGEASKQLAPDAFTLNFSFEQKGADLVSLKNAVDKHVEQASAMLMERGVLSKNIRSMDVTVYPWQENERLNNEVKRVNKGFVYRRSVYFTHNNIQDYDALLKDISALSSKEASIQMGRLQLINKDRDELVRDLVNDALLDAKAKAKSMAQTLDMEVGHVLFMSDGTQAPEHMFENRGRMLQAASADSSTSSVLPGENEIKTQVQVVFELHAVSRKRKSQ